MQPISSVRRITSALHFFKILSKTVNAFRWRWAHLLKTSLNHFVHKNRWSCCRYRPHIHLNTTLLKQLSHSHMMQITNDFTLIVQIKHYFSLHSFNIWNNFIRFLNYTNDKISYFVNKALELMDSSTTVNHDLLELYMVNFNPID